MGTISGWRRTVQTARGYPAGELRPRQTTTMTSITFDGNVLYVEGRKYPMKYAIRNALALVDKIIVLLDPDSYLKDASYGKERRRGKNPLSNLLALSHDGCLAWEAELPEEVDYYYQICSHTPLVALSFSSFQCELRSRNRQDLLKSVFQVSGQILIGKAKGGELICE